MPHTVRSSVNRTVTITIYLPYFVFSSVSAGSMPQLQRAHHHKACHKETPSPTDTPLSGTHPSTIHPFSGTHSPTLFLRFLVFSFPRFLVSSFTPIFHCVPIRRFLGRVSLWQPNSPPFLQTRSSFGPPSVACCPRAGQVDSEDSLARKRLSFAYAIPLRLNLKIK